MIKCEKLTHKNFLPFLEAKLFGEICPVKFDESPEAPLSRLDDGFPVLG
jgi:hypothetical protein